MISRLWEKKEKKVEYVELIYDLIFVYIVGRNNSLLHSFSGGFVTWEAFAAYGLSTLAVIQIWNYSTYYINMYGRHGARDHVFLFVNMFLLYFVGAGTRPDWQSFHTQYHIAWALILVNVGVQYLLELRNQTDPDRRRQLRRMAAILLAEAALAAADILWYRRFGSTWLTLGAILFGMCATVLFGQRSSGGYVDFPHLSERVMLYVVFTFGEMIVGAASYFDGGFTLRGGYFALMAFLIVVGLFLSYGVFYDRIIDRERSTNGLGYMLLHIFIIFALNNITNGLEFMREEELDLLPKLLFLVGSFLLYFGFLFALGLRHARARCEGYSRLCLAALALGLLFAGAMLLLRGSMVGNIALTAVFIFLLFALLRRYAVGLETPESC